eukprot:scaffold8863_cov131-Skeletonema_dohrnii-CCMP3373.AAC.1
MEPHTPKKTRRKRGRGPKKSAEAATGRYQEKAQDVMATESTAAVATATIRPLQEEEHSEEEELKGILDPLERSDDKGDAASGDQSSDGELPSDIDSDDGSDDAPAASNPPTARGSDADDDNVSDASEQPATQATRAAKAKKTAAKARSTRAALGKKKKTAPKSNKSASTRSSFATKSHTFNMPKWLEDEIGIPHTNPAFQLLIDEGWVSPLDLTLLEEETFQTIFEKKKSQSIPILAQQRLLHAYKWAIRCKAIGREVTEATMARGVIQDFAEEWKEIEEQMDRKEQPFPAFTS